MTVKTSENKELVKEIRKKIAENKKKYGKQYCPCSIVHDDDHVCMCKDFIEQESGECHCGLYIKEA